MLFNLQNVTFVIEMFVFFGYNRNMKLGKKYQEGVCSDDETSCFSLNMISYLTQGEKSNGKSNKREIRKSCRTCK